MVDPSDIATMKKRIATRYLLASRMDDYRFEDLIEGKSKIKFIKKLLHSNAQFERAGEQFAYETGLSFEEVTNDGEKDLIETDEFQTWFLEDWAPQHLEEVKEDIRRKTLIQGGKMKIWREMRGPPADHPYDSWIEYFQSDDPHHLGIYWSYIKSEAKAHQAPYEGSGQYVTIQASVDVDKINWKRTLLQHMDQDYHVLEKEIRLYKGTPLEIEKLWIDGEEYTTQDMEDKNMRRQFVASLQ